MNKTNKTKTLTREAMLRNISGLSVGDRAYCGPYGTVTCTCSACDNYSGDLVDEFNSAGNYRGMTVGFKRNTRRFSVSGCMNKKLANRGNYTMKQLRKAICG